ncbi:MAG: DMT family transporter [Corynebacteriales bacterium]|nr:DMT family transporter [Mycobacteriales bacterium]
MLRPPVGVAIGVAVTAGIAGAVQPRINAELAAKLGSDIVTALLSFGVGLLILLTIAFSRRSSRIALRKIPTAPTPWWTYFTGFGGACAVTLAVVTVPTLGVALFSIALFSGSVLASLMVDRFGLGPTGHRPLTWQRGAAAALALAAVVSSQMGVDLYSFESTTVFYLIAVMLAGALTAFQSAGGGRFSAAVGDPVVSAVVNFSGGTFALGMAVIGLHVFGHLPSLHPPSEPWWYSGGALGVVFVTSAFIAVGTLGVMRVTLAMLAGQLSGGVMLDLLPSGPGLHGGVIVGVVLIFVAVMLSNRGQTSEKDNDQTSPGET